MRLTQHHRRRLYSKWAKWFFHCFPACTRCPSRTRWGCTIWVGRGALVRARRVVATHAVGAVRAARVRCAPGGRVHDRVSVGEGRVEWGVACDGGRRCQDRGGSHRQRLEQQLQVRGERRGGAGGAGGKRRYGLVIRDVVGYLHVTYNLDGLDEMHDPNPASCSSVKIVCERPTWLGYKASVLSRLRHGSRRDNPVTPGPCRPHSCYLWQDVRGASTVSSDVWPCMARAPSKWPPFDENDLCTVEEMSLMCDRDIWLVCWIFSCT
ncbi:hypothetical protein C8Q80DRAFT_321396 [Daedaleopsis nitida]|nr:hypothetical protein C8Q80DRAFT_321396 [Daedaleopsis nitida]